MFDKIKFKSVKSLDEALAFIKEITDETESSIIGMKDSKFFNELKEAAKEFKENLENASDKAEEKINSFNELIQSILEHSINNDSDKVCSSNRVAPSVYASVLSRLPANAYRDDKTYVIEVLIPGIDKNRIFLETEEKSDGNKILTLALKDELTFKRVDEITEWLQISDNTSRVFTLTDSKETVFVLDKISSKLENGVLTIIIPLEKTVIASSKKSIVIE